MEGLFLMSEVPLYVHNTVGTFAKLPAGVENFSSFFLVETRTEDFCDPLYRGG